MARRVSDARIIEALKASKGLVSPAAKKLGISRETIHKRIREHPKVKQAVIDAREEILDLAEAQLLKSINQGEIKSIHYILDRLGGSRGYCPRSEVQTEISGPNGGPVTVNHVGSIPYETLEEIAFGKAKS